MTTSNNRKGNTSGRGGNDRKRSAGPSKPMNKRKKPAAAKEEAPTGAKPKFDRKPADKKPVAKKATTSDELRLNKYISNSGMCSRRDADIYIQSGNVKVNGNVVTEMGYKVKLADKVEFDGVLITPEKKEYLLLNKPKNFTTSGEGESGYRNVTELISNATKIKLMPVGRMDRNTTGLMLFTNDNDVIMKFTNAKQTSFKIYQVSLDRNLKFEDLEKIGKGVEIDGHRVYVEEISYIDDQPKTEIGLKLRTSNVKVVRSVFEQAGYNVLKVDRVSFAGLTKKNLPRGHWRFLTEQEVINLKNA